MNGFTAGDKLIIGTPATKETVTITTVGTAGPTGTGVDFTPALAKSHVNGEGVVDPGTGLELAAPLKFNHSANIPFSARGTGITFTPATAFAHSSNEPIQALGTGITVGQAPRKCSRDRRSHLRRCSHHRRGYQGSPSTQCSGSAAQPSLPPPATFVLRDAAGLVVDSLNYGLNVDPWASKGYQAESGASHSGCKAPALATGGGGGFGPAAAPVAGPNRSAGRFPDGSDTDSNCADFLTQAATTLSAASTAGANNVKVASVAGFTAGQTIMVDTANPETAVIATVGTPGATTVGTATAAGATAIPIAAGGPGFTAGQTITVGSGADLETAVIASITRGGFGGPGRGTASVNVSAPLKFAHAAGDQFSGTGITLTSPLTHEHASGAQISDNVPTPGAPNKYTAKRQ